MQTALSDDVFKAPLVKPKTLAMLRMCRKMIFQEFGIKLNLAQPNLIEKVNDYARQSKQSDLRTLVDMLENELS